MVFCLCCACLMTFYAMLYGLLAKSRYNPGTLVLNLTVLIYIFFFNPSSLFTFLSLCGRGGLLVCSEENTNKCCAFQILHLSKLLQTYLSLLTGFRNTASNISLRQRKKM